MFITPRRVATAIAGFTMLAMPCMLPDIIFAMLASVPPLAFSQALIGLISRF
jgi:hypothetical protein